MARLTYTPPLKDGAVSFRRNRHDGISRVTYAERASLSEPLVGTLTIGDAATLVATFAPDGPLKSVTVEVKAAPTAQVVQRVNRLLSGLGPDVPVLAHYHRTASTAWRIPGRWGTLPVVFTVSGEGTVTGLPPAPSKSPRKAPVGPRKPRVAPTTAKAPVAAPEPSEAPLRVTAKAARVDPAGLMQYPVLDKRGEVKVSAETLNDLDMLWRMHVAGEKQVLALVGPTGTAKTKLAKNLAARHGVGIFTFDTAGAREFSDWVGQTHYREGVGTTFVPSGFLSVIDADGNYAGEPRIVLIDEANRAESSQALNVLIALLHEFGSVYIPEMGRSVAIDPAVMVVLTMNRGSAYSGTVAMDLAVSDRVTSWVDMPYLPEGDEVDLLVERTLIEREDAKRLVLCASQVRIAAERGDLPEGGGISTRRLLDAAMKRAHGFSLHRAASVSWLGSFTAEGGTASERAIVRQAIDGVLRGL